MSYCPGLDQEVAETTTESYPSFVLRTRVALFVAGVALVAVTPNAVGAPQDQCTLIGLPSAICGHGGSRPLSPRWSAQWLQANPGQPLVLILNPRAARVCFVGLRGPQGVRPVGWRFQLGGHLLSLTLLTRADATAGSWILSARCQRRGATGHTATVTISVPAPGGSNVLAAHSDMRVQLLPARPS